MKCASLKGQSFFSPMVFSSISLLGVSYIVYYWCLQKIPLSFAQPFSAAFVIGGITFVSWYFLAEKISLFGLAGLFLILIGIILINI